MEKKWFVPRSVIECATVLEERMTEAENGEVEARLMDEITELMAGYSLPEFELEENEELADEKNRIHQDYMVEREDNDRQLHFEYDNVETWGGGQKPASPFKAVNGKWGLKSPNGEMVVEARYEDIRPMADGFAVKRNGRWFLIDDSEGDYFDQTPHRFCESSASFDEMPEPLVYSSFYKVKVNGSYGVWFQTADKFCLEPIYTDIHNDEKHCAIISELNGLYGYMDNDFTVFPQFREIICSRVVGFLRVVDADNTYGYVASNCQFTTDIAKARVLSTYYPDYPDE